MRRLFRSAATSLAALLFLLTACSAPAAQSNAVLPCPNYNAGIVSSLLASVVPMEGAENLLGATMPHYAPMMKLGVPVLAAAAQSRKIETVVLLAPNHKGEGPPVELSGSGYFWPDGSVEGDGDAAAFLRKTAVPDAAEDRQILSEEYAASLWAPYIAQLFPGAKVVTLLFTRGVQTETLSRLADALLALSEDRELFVLCSIDFSHYQTPEKTLQNDEVTREAVQNRDLSFLRRLDGAYLDCPEALSVLLCMGDVSELDYQTIVYRDAAGTSGASYFIYGLEKPDRK